jgi:hypothetical protein
MSTLDISKCSLRDKFEYKMSKLSDKKLERIQRILIERICKAEADTLDFYDYKKTEKKFREKELNENY